MPDLVNRKLSAALQKFREAEQAISGLDDSGDLNIANVNDAGALLVALENLDIGVDLDVALGVATEGGTLLYKNIDVDESEDQVKATAGQIYWIHAINLSDAPLFLKIYNATAANVTVGTTVPDLTFPVPTAGSANGAGFVLAIATGIEFDTAITIAATTGVADGDVGVPGANELIVNLGYA